ncbi:hypothetical protein RRG08_025143 [Elysia crispata]|uniref:Uncharacterized protein n=1 Tax=Elysia crispata TaxID=231223 RepID=A0AAE1CW13_9GAST|nr:hypothetical protein RRG08_025143 [Elysia crispata]
MATLPEASWLASQKCFCPMARGGNSPSYPVRLYHRAKLDPYRGEQGLQRTRAGLPADLFDRGWDLPRNKLTLGTQCFATQRGSNSATMSDAASRILCPPFYIDWVIDWGQFYPGRHIRSSPVLWTAFTQALIRLAWEQDGHFQLSQYKVRCSLE